MYETRAKWKKEWFDYLKANRQYWRDGWTIRYLNDCQQEIYLDREITFDLLRHGADKNNPTEMVNSNKELFDHCMSNFGSLIHKKILDSIKITR